MIDPFPGQMRRCAAWGTPYILTPEQEAWLRKWYPIEKNDVLALMMGVCHYSTIIRLAHKLGLKKDRAAYAKRMSEVQLKLVESERRRGRWGLPRRTTYHLPTRILTKAEIRRRWNAKLRGYIIADARSEEGWWQRHTIYYDENTNRNKKFEIFCKKAGFEIKKKDYLS